LRRHVKKHKQIIADAAETVLQATRDNDEQQSVLVRNLDALEKQSKIRLAHGAVHATIQPPSGRREFDILRVDNWYDMTRWKVTKPNGSSATYDLTRLSMYPMIIAETMRMGFARIGKTRITYIRKSVDWTNQKLKIDDLSLNVSVTFPSTDTRRRNIAIKLTHHNLGSCDFALLFTGSEVRLVSRKFQRGSDWWIDEHKQFTKQVEEKLFGTTKGMRDFFQQFFKHFTYKELRRDDHNVRDYLTGTRFRLSVIQHVGNPFLVIKRDQ
jgi:hemerythrin